MISYELSPYNTMPCHAILYHMLKIFVSYCVSYFYRYITAHTVDNTFLGFVVPSKEIKIKQHERDSKNIALLYGKDPDYMKVNQSSKKMPSFVN